MPSYCSQARMPWRMLWVKRRVPLFLSLTTREQGNMLQTTTGQQHRYLTEQMGQRGDMTYSRKNGNQQAMKEPIIIPEIEI